MHTVTQESTRHLSGQNTEHECPVAPQSKRKRNRDGKTRQFLPDSQAKLPIEFQLLLELDRPDILESANQGSGGQNQDNGHQPRVSIKLRQGHCKRCQGDRSCYGDNQIERPGSVVLTAARRLVLDYRGLEIECRE